MSKTPPFKILFTINNLDTAGMKKVLVDIALGLDPGLFKPTIYVGRYSDNEFEKNVQNSFPVVQWPIKSNGSKGLIPFKVLYKSVCLFKNFDLVHSFDYSSDWTEGLTTKIAGIPWVIEKTNLNFKKNKWEKRLNLATRIIALSNAQKQQLTEWDHKVRIIPTGIDYSKFEHAEPDQRKKWGFKPDDFVFISVAHLVWVKGHEPLLQAFSYIVSHYPNARLLLVGEGEPDFRAQLEKLRDELELENNVIFAGKSEKIPQVLKMGDAKILATRNEGRREGFGAALIEAMASGKPVIGTMSGGPEDIIDHEENGYLVEAEGYQPLLQPMMALIENPEWAKRLGKSGQDKVRQCYTKEQMVKQYEAVYKEILDIN